MADELDDLAERPHWTVTAGVATYQPEPGAWCARVRAVRVPGRAGDRWHLAIVDPSGMAHYTTTAVFRHVFGPLSFPSKTTAAAAI